MAAAREKEKKRSLLTIKTGASSGQITKLKQSILLRCLWARVFVIDEAFWLSTIFVGKTRNISKSVAPI
jgi:hypothetical protein